MKPGYYAVKMILHKGDNNIAVIAQTICQCAGKHGQQLYRGLRLWPFSSFHFRLSASCVHVTALHELVQMFSADGALPETETRGESTIPNTSLACKWVKP